MTALHIPPLSLDRPLPRMVSPFKVKVGDLVEVRDELLPVIVTGTGLQYVNTVLDWITVARTSKRVPVAEGCGSYEPGEFVKLIARGEDVPAGLVCDDDVLLFDDRESTYGVVTSAPRWLRFGVLDIPFVAGKLPTGFPAVFGNVQCSRFRMVRRAARGVAS